MKIAALTMVRNDDFHLRKWVEYYGKQFGRENLFIYFDGLDQSVPDFCAGTNCSIQAKVGSDMVSSDKGRIKFLSAKAAELFDRGYGLI